MASGGEPRRECRNTALDEEAVLRHSYLRGLTREDQSAWYFGERGPYRMPPGMPADKRRTLAVPATG